MSLKHTATTLFAKLGNDYDTVVTFRSLSGKFSRRLDVVVASLDENTIHRIGEEELAVR